MVPALCSQLSFGTEKKKNNPRNFDTKCIFRSSLLLQTVTNAAMGKDYVPRYVLCMLVELQRDTSKNFNTERPTRNALSECPNVKGGYVFSL